MRSLPGDGGPDGGPSPDPVISSYGHPEALGHRYLDGLLSDPVVVQEKIDGSQFSVAKIDGRLVFRSRKQEVHPGAAGMFEAGVRALIERTDLLHEGWVYRGEYLSKPKHNTLAYGRTPLGHLILFDVETAEGQHFLAPAHLAEEADRVELESVPVFHDGLLGLTESVEPFLETESILGGVKVEGVVVKNYLRFGVDGKVLMGKLVRADFKEAHRQAWPKANPGAADIIEDLIATYKTEARWRKAVQHLAEDGRLQNAPQDIGPLLEEVATDVAAEEADAIKDVLWRWAWPKVRRGVGGGLPAWYKDRLAAGQP